jgi:hypothetical protein
LNLTDGVLKVNYAAASVDEIFTDLYRKSFLVRNIISDNPEHDFRYMTLINLSVEDVIDINSLCEEPGY